MTSDHLPVLFTIHHGIKHNPKRNFKNYKEANWNKYRKDINQNLRINRQLENEQEINECIQNLTTIISNAAKENIPNNNTNTNNKWTRNIREKIQESNRQRKKFQRARRDRDRLELDNLNNIVKVLINSYTEEQWKNKIENDTKNQNIWKTIKTHKNRNIHRKKSASRRQQNNVFDQY